MRQRRHPGAVHRRQASSADDRCRRSGPHQGNPAESLRPGPDHHRGHAGLAAEQHLVSHLSPDGVDPRQLIRNAMTPVDASADRESIFNRIADYVSAAMGRPTNIMIWLVLVVGWTALFAAHVVSPNANFLPSWFTGTAFNFPLNLVTTVAELFIGFLVAAAANRSERNLTALLGHIRAGVERDVAVESQIIDVEDNLTALLKENTDLTKVVATNTARIDELHADLKAICAHFGIALDPGKPSPS